MSINGSLIITITYYSLAVPHVKREQQSCVAFLLFGLNIRLSFLPFI